MIYQNTQPIRYRMNKTKLKRLLLVGVQACLITAPCLAQTAPASPEDTSVPVQMSGYVVTGRAGTDIRTKFDSSYSITTKSAEDLALQAPMGVAESLLDIPGFWVEASGGEASANVRSRGIPTDGYSTVNLLEDGIPIQHDPSLGYLNADQTFRLDQTIQTMEVVRGGPSTTFYSNAPGGSVNYITRKGDTGSDEGILRYEEGDFGDHRIDFYSGGPIGSNMYGAVGGFYRVNRGVRDAGFNFNNGGQLRVSIGKKIANGTIDFSIKRIDDTVGFYLGTPFTFNSSGKVIAVPGFNGNYGTLDGKETTHFMLPSASGPFDFDNTLGTNIKLTQFTVLAKLDLGDGWRLENSDRYRDSVSIRNGLYPAALTVGTTYLSSQLATLKSLYPTVVSDRLQYVTSPSQVFDPVAQNGNGIVDSASMRSVTMPEREFINDTRFLKKFNFDGQSHDLTFGLYLATINETFTRYSAQMLTDVQNNARLLDIVGLNAAGQVVGALSENGFTRYGNEWADASGQQVSSAFYLSDEWTINRQLRVDVSAREEGAKIDTTNQSSMTVNLGVSPTPADRTVLTGTGLWTPADVKFSRTMWTVGVDYSFNKNLGAFARETIAHKVPSEGDFITNPTNVPRIATMNMQEAGLKFGVSNADLYLTAFHTGYNSYSVSALIFNPATNGYVSQSEFANTDTTGLEVDGNYRFCKWFGVNAEATLQSPKFDNFPYVSAVSSSGVQTITNFNGNQLLRVPKVSFRVTPKFDLPVYKLHFELPVQHFSARYADAANTQMLPQYTVLNFRARASVSKNVTLYLTVDNLTNTIGLTEGNARGNAFISGDASAQYYIARSILGRNGRIAIEYKY